MYFSKIYEFQKENSSQYFPVDKRKGYKKYRLKQCNFSYPISNIRYYKNLSKYKTKYCLDNDLI